jgi:hypothetical protein
MNAMLMIAAGLTAAIAVAHSALGEKLVLGPLLASDVPKLGGSSRFMRRTVRYAWHLTSLWGFAFAGLLLWYARDTAPHASAVRLLSVAFLASALVSAVMTRGKHFSWFVFLVIGLLAWFS